MASEEKRRQTSSVPVEPRGFGKRSSGLAAEYAHEQGWGLDIDERTKISQTPENPRGKEYDYGARDFGDEPRNTEGPQTEILQNIPGSSSNDTGNTTTNEASSISINPTERAQPQKEELKKHGDPLDRVLEEVQESSQDVSRVGKLHRPK